MFRRQCARRRISKLTNAQNTSISICDINIKIGHGNFARAEHLDDHECIVCSNKEDTSDDRPTMTLKFKIT